MSAGAVREKQEDGATVGHKSCVCLYTVDMCVFALQTSVEVASMCLCMYICRNFTQVEQDLL